MATNKNKPKDKLNLISSITKDNFTKAILYICK